VPVAGVPVAAAALSAVPLLPTLLVTPPAMPSELGGGITGGLSAPAADPGSVSAAAFVMPANLASPPQRDVDGRRPPRDWSTVA
jgi:hypothetical protein